MAEANGSGGNKFYISVILPLKLEWEPCYNVRTDDIPKAVPGAKVKVAFAGRQYTGVIHKTGVTPEVAAEKVKDIISVDEKLGLVSAEEMELWQKVAGYYLCSTGEVYKAAYPASKISQEETLLRMKERQELRSRKTEESIRLQIGRAETRLEKKEKILDGMLEAVRSGKKRKAETIEKAEKDCDALRHSVNELYAKLRQLKEDTGKAESGRHPASDLPRLSQEQSRALDEIKSSFENGRPALLYGVTGSGKTEIYIRLAAETLEKGRNVLYLVPEIALSRQLEERLESIFGETLITFHSGESQTNRRDAAARIKLSGEKRNYILLGTRSSVFLPHKDIGLIIVDEEHDGSYKQDSPAPRYNGRDTAIMMAGIHRSRILLGSATPSMESLYNCSCGKYDLVRIEHKYHNAPDAEIEIIDTVAERKKNGMTGAFSRKLALEIRKTLDRGEQTIILRSRRAYSPVLQCTSCGDIPKCPHCNVSLTYHKNPEKMCCHYCGYSREYDPKCRKCGNPLAGIGSGTQKIEEEARTLFPSAVIARLDSDTAPSNDIETIRKFSNGETDILIGTQMVTKGFDFPDLSLVAVIAADSLLGMQDFRADEKALQILEQFRGRCSRRGKQGKFIIQTSQPGHPVYRQMLSGQRSDLYETFLTERKEFGYPPFTRIVKITVRNAVESTAERQAARLSSILRHLFRRNGTVSAENDGHDETVTGPYRPVIDRIADYHIREVRVNLKKDRMLAGNKALILQAAEMLQKEENRKCNLSVDVDPL